MIDNAENRKTWLMGAYGAQFWRLITRQKTAQAILALLDDPALPGATDAVVLSYISMWIRLNWIQKVLQLGTWIGLSSLVIADAIVERYPAGRLVTVDPNPYTNAKAQGYLEQACLQHNVTIMEGKSLEPDILSQLASEAPFDMIYIDSSHAYENTREEIKRFTLSTWLSPRGVIFFHDAAPDAAAYDPTGQGGVPRALAEALPQAVILKPPFFNAGMAMWWPGLTKS
jgi:predicted O-methyltransferase YrrM